MIEPGQRVAVGEPIPPEFSTATGINQLLEAIDDLRASVRPLLRQPFSYDDAGRRTCIFCYAVVQGPGVVDYPHAPDCPVRRRDELLGQETEAGRG